MSPKKIISFGLLCNSLAILFIYTLISINHKILFFELIKFGGIVLLGGISGQYLMRKSTPRAPSFLTKEASQYLLLAQTIPLIMCTFGYIYMMLFEYHKDGLVWPFLPAPYSIGSAIIKLKLYKDEPR